jgi:hypothetical protein
MWKVQSPQSASHPTVVGAWGFNVTTEDGRPVVGFTYETRGEASVAAIKIQEAIEKAIDVRACPE